MTCNVIATGSQGNAVVLDRTILVDCGVPFRALEDIYTNIGLVVLTHIHSDHFHPQTIQRLASLRPSLRFLCPTWLHQSLRSLGIREQVIDEVRPTEILFYGHIPGGSYEHLQFDMTPIPHDVPNCAWRISGKVGNRVELVFYATDCGSLDGVTARDYDLYLIEANYNEVEIQERMHRKLEAGMYAYESRAMESHLSREQAEAWLSENARSGKSKVLFLHQHAEGNR